MLYHQLPGSVYDYDRGKLVILTAGTNLSGHALAEVLREQFKLETEMSAADYVIAMTSVCDTDEGFDRLLSALIEIDSRCKSAEHTAKPVSCSLPRQHCTIGEALDHDGKTLDIDTAEGKVSREYIRVYPPGVPLIVPGEIIDSDVLSQLRRLEAAGNEIQSDRSTFPLVSICG